MFYLRFSTEPIAPKDSYITEPRDISLWIDLIRTGGNRLGESELKKYDMSEQGKRLEKVLGEL